MVSAVTMPYPDDFGDKDAKASRHAATVRSQPLFSSVFCRDVAQLSASLFCSMLQPQTGGSARRLSEKRVSSTNYIRDRSCEVMLAIEFTAAPPVLMGSRKLVGSSSRST